MPKRKAAPAPESAPKAKKGAAASGKGAAVKIEACKS